MARCFVAQPFDSGEFDKRYDQVYEPAIRAAGLEPYRIDRDPRASIPVDTMMSEIQSCTAFFVDISADNPNVWFEFGLAVAFRQGACIVCSTARTKFPFDVQHRQILRYKTEAPDDFVDLQNRVTARLKAIVEQQQSLDIAESKLDQIEHVGGVLSDVEVITLAVIAGEARLDHHAAIWEVYAEMAKAGFNNVGTSVALRRLLRRSFITKEQGTNFNGEDYDAMSLTEPGWQWIDNNLERVGARTNRGKGRQTAHEPIENSRGKPDDESPF